MPRPVYRGHFNPDNCRAWDSARVRRISPHQLMPMRFTTLGPCYSGISGDESREESEVSTRTPSSHFVLNAPAVPLRILQTVPLTKAPEADSHMPLMFAATHCGSVSVLT
jgi:hypothetical protein